MSLLFTENNPEKCQQCGATQFALTPVVQVTKDKKEQHLTGHRLECIICGHKHNVPKNYFDPSKR